VVHAKKKYILYSKIGEKETLIYDNPAKRVPKGKENLSTRKYTCLTKKQVEKLGLD